jgi:hypothetical protein
LYTASSTGIGQYNTLKHTTSLTLSVPLNVPWSTTAAISGKLIDISAANAGIGSKTITYSSSNGSPLPASVATTSTGTYSSSFKATKTVFNGWKIQSNFAGDSLYNTASSPIDSYNTIKHTASLILAGSPNVPWSTATTFIAILKDLSNASAPLAAQTIHFTGTGVINVADKMTDNTGKAAGTGISPNTVASGWTDQAQYAGNTLYTASSTGIGHYNTLKHTSSLSLVISPTLVPAGGTYGVSGTLKDTTRATGLSGMTISFTADPPITISSTTTGTTGTYAVTGLTAPTTPATYHITAHFAATSLYNAANSTVQSITTTVTMDQFGIKDLYASKTGGEHWNVNMQSESNDPQFGPNGATLTKNADGTYNVQSSSVRLQIFTSTGFQENQIKTLNQVQLAAQGYMLRPNDWKNVEITGYLKPNHFSTSTSNGAAHIEYVARGARNTNDNYLVGGYSAQCEATTYHSNTYMTGRVKFEKDLMHTAGYTANSQDPQILNAVNMALGKWVGIKAVYYNFPNGTVKLEQWVDDSTDNINAPGNKWHKVLDFTDHGQWGGGQPNCGGTPSTIITWGGPIALFRWDNIDNMDFKNFSIREIQAPFG